VAGFWLDDRRTISGGDRGSIPFVSVQTCSQALVSPVKYIQGAISCAAGPYVLLALVFV
jgi:hypothetical protein